MKFPCFTNQYGLCEGDCDNCVWSTQQREFDCQNFDCEYNMVCVLDLKHCCKFAFEGRCKAATPPKWADEE